MSRSAVGLERYIAKLGICEPKLLPAMEATLWQRYGDTAGATSPGRLREGRRLPPLYAMIRAAFLGSGLRLARIREDGPGGENF